MYIGSSENSYSGLFGYVSKSNSWNGGVIKNLTVKDSRIIQDTNASKCIGIIGGLIGVLRNCKTINCEIKVSNISTLKDENTSTEMSIGGVVGRSREMSLIRNETNLNLNGVEPNCIIMVGGINGKARGNVEKCLNAGNIEIIQSQVRATYVGGITGFFFDNNANSVLKMVDSYNIGSIMFDGRGSRCTGGIVGENRKSVERCYNLGNITSNTPTGGITGINEDNSEVINCYNRGEIRKFENYTYLSYKGGITGINSSVLDDGKKTLIENCYSISIKGGKDFGSLVGSNNRKNN